MCIEAYSFGLPVMIGDKIRSVVSWSRIFDNREILVAINTDGENSSSAWVTVPLIIYRLLSINGNQSPNIFPLLFL